MFKHSGMFAKWKAELVVTLTRVALAKSGSKRTEMEVPIILGAIALLVSAPSFTRVFQALRCVLPFQPSLAESLTTLEKVDQHRRYGVGGSGADILDAYASCPMDERATKEVAREVDEAMAATTRWLQTGVSPGGLLNAWQKHLFHLATLNDRVK